MPRLSREFRPQLIGKVLACLCAIALQIPAALVSADKPAARTDKIKFKDDAGKTALSLKIKDDGAKLTDGNEQELARFTLSGNKIKIKDAHDNVLGYVVASGEKLRLEGTDQKTELFSLQHQADGDWKLEDPQQARVYTIKRREYGAEIEGPQKASLYKVKVKSGKTSLRNAADKSVYHTDDAISAPAMSCLGFDKISDVRLRAALLFAVDHGPKK